VFGGKIPDDLKALVHEHAASWGHDTVHVGCSGNFTVEAALKLAGVKAVHSNDVTLYSCVLGGYLANKPAEIAVAPDLKEEWGWLEQEATWGDPQKQLATVMQVSQAMQWWRKAGGYYDRMMRAWRDQFDVMYAKTLDRVKAFDLRVDSFTAMDVFDWADTLDKDGALVCYPPFVGFEDAYAKLYEKLDLVFDWPDRPDYEILEDDRQSEFWKKLPEFDSWMTGSNRPIPELTPYLLGVTKRTNRAPTIHVYGASGRKAYIRPHQDTEPVMVPRLGPHEEIGEKLTIAPISYGQFCTLRSQYMNKGIRPGQAMLSVAVLVDGVLVGAFAFAPGKYLEDVYLLSDFPVAPVRYKRLAKLVCIAALSREARLLAERMLSHRCATMSTTAFTNNAVSMKYRGLFTLAKRTKTDVASKDWAAELGGELNSYYRREWELKYDAPMGQWTLDEGMAMWVDKHSQMTDRVEARVAAD
jgi:hypothetical protein